MNLILHKMNTSIGEPIEYRLFSDDKPILINDFLHKKLEINWSGNIFCQKCAKKTKRSFGQGFCYPCFISAPEASPCIIKPELCQAHLGIGRDIEFEQKHHNQPHIVYMAATDKVKVGVTRDTQVPTRWIDQGANKAIILAETPNRYLAGVTEVALKSFYSDKTNWRSMLKNLQDHNIDLEEEKWKCHDLLPSDLQQYFVENDDVIELNYPVNHYPEKITSLNLEKQESISGVLTGIKGQYLMFDEQYVFNVRRHTSFEIEMITNG
jgi:hypothetical protein